MIEIPGKEYKSIDECMAVFFDCEIDDLDKMAGRFEMKWADGKEEEWDVQTAILHIRKRTCWAWVEDKTVIHFYVGPDATMTQIIKLFGHELGHTQRPFHRDLKEEQKADKYSNVAEAAYQMALQVVKNRS